MNYTVTQLNTYIKNMFQGEIGLNNIYVKGEISNCKYHTSGHIYFTLKDAGGQVAGVMFAGNRANGLKFRLEEGQNVVIYGCVSIYERDGKYQLYAKAITLDGLGVLYQKYEELKKLLELQGLFDVAHKKEIPKFAKKVGIVTARTGAALQDIINISKRRNPYVELILYPAIVQGAEAASSIVKAIKELDKLNLDVLIVGRGGGSIEDLWAFNEEIVARAVYECNTPVISAVGHETDTTIIDYVSDLRAPTPSAAAELAVFNYQEFVSRLDDYKMALNHRMNTKLSMIKYRLESYKSRLEHGSPDYKVNQYKQYLSELEEKLRKSMLRCQENKRHQLQILAQKLEAKSPLKRLGGGYAFVVDDKGKNVTSASDLKVDDKLVVTMRDGKVKATVDDIEMLDAGI